MRPLLEKSGNSRGGGLCQRVPVFAGISQIDLGRSGFRAHKVRSQSARAASQLGRHGKNRPRPGRLTVPLCSREYSSSSAQASDELEGAINAPDSIAALHLFAHDCTWGSFTTNARLDRSQPLVAPTGKAELLNTGRRSSTSSYTLVPAQAENHLGFWCAPCSNRVLLPGSGGA